MSIFTKIFNSGAKDLIETVGTAIDKIHTSKEEKEVLKNEINEKILDYEQNMQKQVTRRWESDMQGNWLTKSFFVFIVKTTFFSIF